MDNTPYIPGFSATGVRFRDSFLADIAAVRASDPLGWRNGQYAIVFLDVVRFKAVNDVFGREEGDRLLVFILDTIQRAAKSKKLAYHLYADYFMFLTHTSGKELESVVEGVLSTIGSYDLPFEILCNAGIYVSDAEDVTVESMADRAIIAQSTIKGSYTHRFAYFTSDLRDHLLDEQEITGVMVSALEQEQFLVYYQPQYNHSTGMLVGAEALVRWNHPTRGLVSPSVFIPIFERNGFISRLDLYVFEHVCRFLRSFLDSGKPVVAISTNLARYDLFQPDFIDRLEEIRKKYDIPVEYLRLEITETAVMDSTRHIQRIVSRLHELGYLVEMDDFGSGYSSLNVLKDIDFDIIKLDLVFLSGGNLSARGGTILSSCVRMVNWLNLPLIAEGVETVKQADFLRSVGCNYIQGYLYSRPLPEADFRELLSGTTLSAIVPQLNLIDTLDAGRFWSPDSLETLIFSNFVGGAAIFEYKNGGAEILRVNEKYLRELGMNLSEKELISSDPLKNLSDADLETYKKMLDRAIETGDEQECETWRTITSACCGDELICIRSTVRMIGKSDTSYLFYAMIRNITSEKRRFDALEDSERRFKAASEQVNIYYWEYTVATKEMRPCFRCMRDLGLPALVTNYPEPAIEMGIFPPEVADMYRDWHKQIAAGVPHLEAVIPLTVGRVPFHVRYTTEFDEAGHPVKAYGSAALVIENNPG